MNAALELKQTPEPQHEELLQEAKAWGYDSWEAYCDAMAEAYDIFEQEL